MSARLEKPSISFFFPAYNEEDTVEELARRAERVLRAVAGEYEAIIFDAGSPDVHSR